MKSETRYAICSALDRKPITESLANFLSEQAAQDKLRDLTERGVITGIPVVILPVETTKTL